MKNLFALFLLLLPAIALADEPKFEFKKQDDKKTPHWDVQGKAGLLLSGGNSQSVSASAGLTAAHTWDSNRFLIEGALAYVRSQVTTATDLNGNGVIEPDEVQTITQTTSNAAVLKARYDRYFGGADENSAFVSGRVASDPPAGKQILGGGQLGVSREIFKSDRFLTTAELGYDYTYEKDEDAPPVIVPGVSIHSLRGFLQETVRFPPQIGAAAKIEVLENVNSESAPNENGSGTIDPFKDLRVNANVTLTAALNTRVSIALGFTARYDMAPALKPAFKLPYAPGFTPFADKVDTLTEASVVVNFL